MSTKMLKVLVSIGIGCAMIYFGGRVLGVRLELFWGLSTYSLAWISVLFVLPFVTGGIIGWLYGPGGKIVAHFPPLIVHGMNYIQTMNHGAPHGSSLMPLGWWGLYALLTMEFCAFGAFAGEFLLQRAVVARRDRQSAESGEG